ncbi:MAG TPA: hypothetical protein PKM25_11325 [Candidatus Ozemobacteraceae bacterium]|nr:hypothetical protein [Candidatus Ozemobacteraceae bacterium]
MPRSCGPALAIASILLSALSPAVFAGELPESLRKASELYRTGHLDEARSEALSVQRFFPDDIEALLILGRIDFEAGRYSDAKQWFRLASAKHATHPLVKRYRKLLEELEYRLGQFDPSPLPLPTPDKEETAKRFKKGWFGPAFTISSADCKPAPMEPALIDRPLADAATSDTGSSSLMAFDPDQESEALASEALNNSQYFKSYIMYSQILNRSSGKAAVRLGLARAAIGMGRFSEALGALSPLLSPGAPAETATEARMLAELARRQMP